MVTRHTFEKELADLHLMIIRMGVEVENSINDTIKALIGLDSELAAKIMERDDMIDDLELRIEESCLDIIARQQPVARDLRDVTSALKLITDLERIADHASDISQKIILMAGRKKIMIHYDLITLAELSKEMVRGALDAYVTRSPELAGKIIAMDDRVDKLYEKLKSELVRLMSVDPESLEQYVEMLFVCKYFERIADHSQNVAEWVVFLVQGKHL